MSFEHPTEKLPEFPPEIPKEEEGAEATGMGGDSHGTEGEIAPKYTEKIIRRPKEEGGDVVLDSENEIAA